MEDKWKHRSDRMKCKTCMWFVVKEGSYPPLGRLEPKGEGETIEPLRLIGRCRRHAPTMTGYPVVFEDDWCGDHKIDENK